MDLIGHIRACARAEADLCKTEDEAVGATGAIVHAIFEIDFSGRGCQLVIRKGRGVEIK